MDFIDKNIQNYAELMTTKEPDYLLALNRYTHTNVLKPRMLSGHLQGRFLATISRMMQAEYILDIGTYTGYSALALAEGLKDTGSLHTLEFNEEVAEVAQRFFKQSPYSNNIHLHIGDALQNIQKAGEMVPHWDIVWIDAEKSEYAAYYDLCIGKLRKGGLIMADNVLWSGKVVDEKALLNDEDTKHLHQFNLKIQQDERVSNLLLPIRDGIMMVQKL